MAGRGRPSLQQGPGNHNKFINRQKDLTSPN